MTKIAPTHAVDAKLLDAAIRRDTLCEQMTTMSPDERAAAVPALVALSQEIALLTEERRTILSRTFNS